MLETLIGSIFPNKRFNPQQTKAAGFPFGVLEPDLAAAQASLGNPASFYPGMIRIPKGNDLPDGGFYPGKPIDRETYKTTVIPPKPDEQPATTGGFYPGMETTPSTPPVKKKLSKAERRQRQDEYEARYASMTPEEQQQELIQGKGPVEHSFIKRLAKGALRGLATGGLGGAAVGAAGEGFFPGVSRELDAQTQLPRVTAAIESKNKAADVAQKRRRGQVEVENIEADNQLNREKLDYLKQDQQRKIDDRASREKTSRMNAVAGMFKNLPAVDFNDPKFAELKQAMGDVNLPITNKDAKKKVDLKQDQRSGEWNLILTDPVTGKQETRPVTDKTGKVLATTPTVVMQGEYGMLKQNDQQDFQASENEKNRKQAKDIASERIAIAKENLALAQQRAAVADAKSKADADLKVQKAKESLVRLKAYIKGNVLTSSDEELLRELEDIDIP